MKRHNQNEQYSVQIILNGRNKRMNELTNEGLRS